MLQIKLSHYSVINHPQVFPERHQMGYLPRESGGGDKRRPDMHALQESRRWGRPQRPGWAWAWRELATLAPAGPGVGLTFPNQSVTLAESQNLAWDQHSHLQMRSRGGPDPAPGPSLRTAYVRGPGPGSGPRKAPLHCTPYTVNPAPWGMWDVDV